MKRVVSLIMIAALFLGIGILLTEGEGWGNPPAKKNLTVVLSFDLEVPEGINNLPWILKTLENHSARATFFVTGEMARRYPGEIQLLVEKGNSVGSHGNYHEYPIFSKKGAIALSLYSGRSFNYIWKRSTKTVEDFRRALISSRKALYKATGKYPVMYRSPILTPSVTKNMSYLEVLKDTGFKIDSSLLRRYMGIKEPVVNMDGIVEVPPSISDGSFINIKMCLNSAEYHARMGYPFVIYMHPWKFTGQEHRENFLKLISDLEKKYNVKYMRVDDVALTYSR